MLGIRESTSRSQYARARALLIQWIEQLNNDIKKTAYANDCEKQVKEKVDRISFVPTAPVWEQIQKQIRQKKTSRRFLLWLPIIILLTGSSF